MLKTFLVNFIEFRKFIKDFYGIMKKFWKGFDYYTYFKEFFFNILKILSKFRRGKNYVKFTGNVEESLS